METAKLAELLESMSLTEKIEQMIQFNGALYGKIVSYTGPEVNFDLEPNQQYRVGSVLGEAGAEKLTALQDKVIENQPHHIPAVFMTDIIHGMRTTFPVPLALGSTFDPKLAEKLSSAAARESAASGIHLTFSPMADLCEDSRWGRCMESTGEDPYLNGKMAAAMVKGFQGDDVSAKGKIAACVKHFAGYGAVKAGRDYNVTEISERTFFDDHLPSYKAAIDAGVKLVMTAFNTIDRIPCTVNRRLMKDVLRDKLGFKGVLITDYAAIDESINHGASDDRRVAAKKAIKAGCDIDMMSPCYLYELEKLVKDGEIDEKLIDEAVMRILTLKNELGLFENPYKDADPEAEKALSFCDEHKSLARKAAEESIVLLKNNGILPLKKNAKLAVIGALADCGNTLGTWALFGDREKTVTLKMGIDELYPDANVSYILSDTDIDGAVKAAEAADAVIIALGEDETTTGESRSVTDISLSDWQKKLFDAVLNVNKNIVTVLYGGRPLAVPHEAENSAAMLEVWLAGSMGGYAMADILFGAVSPSGRLSMSMPYCTGQLPISYRSYSTGRPKPDTDDFVPFVSNYMDAPNVPLFPFGYGLSYTEFKYSSVELSDNKLTAGGCIKASVSVKNCGNMASDEVVQLYIRDMKASVVRPMRELKGFERISLGAGESRKIEFTVTEDMLRFHDADMNYTSEKGSFTLWIGGSSLTDNSAEFELV